MNILEALLLLCLLIVISAFVSCSELALASARKIKLQVMAKDGGDTRALDVLNMQQQPGQFYYRRPNRFECRRHSCRYRRRGGSASLF